MLSDEAPKRSNATRPDCERNCPHRDRQGRTHCDRMHFCDKYRNPEAHGLRVEFLDAKDTARYYAGVQGRDTDNVQKG